MGSNCGQDLKWGIRKEEEKGGKRRQGRKGKGNKR